MEALRLNDVVFCGENPGLDLLKPGTETVTAGASYWFCTYSPYGEGHVLMLHLDAENAAALNHPAVAIYADNPALGRYVADTFTQHFGEGWKSANLPNTPIQTARFFRESDSRRFYRIACHVEQTRIELLWQDLRGGLFRNMPNNSGMGAAGDESFHISTVFFLAEQASITINGQKAAGEIETKTEDDGRFSSSAFVALSETWIKIAPDAAAVP